MTIAFVLRALEMNLENDAESKICVLSVDIPNIKTMIILNLV